MPDQRRVRRACSHLALGLLALLTAAPAAAVDIIDQDSSPSDTTGRSLKSIAVSQSFTPSFTTLAFLNVKLYCCAPLDPGPATMRLDIRSGGIAGPVVATTASVLLPDLPDAQLVRFDIAPALAVTPGSTYVFDVVLVSGGQVSTRSGSDPDYPGGQEFNDGVGVIGDLVFQTGVVSDEPPQTSGLPTPVEYSNDVDEGALGGGGQGAGDPGQVLYTEPPDDPLNTLPRDATDFAPLIESGNEPDAQVDALAYGYDHLYTELVQNTAHLVVSFVGDLDLSSGAAEDVAAFMEGPVGVTSVLYTHDDLDAADASNDAIDDVDGIEMWGDVGQDDAFYYSLIGDAATGTSVYVDSSGTQNPFVSHTEIVNAVTALGYTGPASDVDLDALMVRNVGTREEFEIGDEILFSIRGVSQANFDGGEIIRLPAGGAPSFLSHGGHDWDTAFATAAAFDSQSEDVDAIEATPTLPAVPMLTAWWVPALAAMMGAMGVLRLRSVLARNPAGSQR